MHFEAQAQHEWLLRLVGNWTFEGTCLAGPDMPETVSRGKTAIRSLGKAWILCEGVSDMPNGEPGYSIITLGYDTAKQEFVGSFVGSMMSNMWIYEGTLDADEKILTLDTIGPSFTGTGSAPYQDIIEVVDNNHWILRSQVKGENGEWTQFMTGHYRRVQG